MGSEAAFIIDCFDKTLPQLGLPPSKSYITTGSSGNTTAGARPSFRYVAKDVGPYLEKAGAFLHSFKGHGNEISGPQMFAAYPEVEIKNEQGVVAGAMAYTICPIVAALRLRYKGRFKVRMEATHKENYMNDDDEEDTESAVRTDLLFCTVATEMMDSTVIAVIEYKRRKVIRYKDYEKAFLPPKTSRSEAAQNTAGMQKTALLGNAVHQSKQLCTYAARTKCRHVALFNWEHLLIFDFYLLEKGVLKTAGKHANLTWVTEDESMSGKYEEQVPVRKALLGWLLMAFEEAF